LSFFRQKGPTRLSRSSCMIRVESLYDSSLRVSSSNSLAGAKVHPNS
jgi:hypothetical protein